LVAGCTDDHAPHLISVTPGAAPRGAQVTLAGERLCGDPPDCDTAAGAIQIGLALPTTLATVLEYDDDRAVIEVPSTAEIGPTEIIVTVNERASNAIAFEVLAPP
jgi:hypothetical protein